MSDVIVLHAALPGHCGLALEATLMPRLPYAKRLQLERCDVYERRSSLAGIALLLQGAARFATGSFAAASISFPLGGKPFIAGGPRFSISHSASRVAVAVSDRCELGLDLEDRDQAGEHAARSRMGLERWTAIEAALKVAGAGIQSADRVLLAPDHASAQVGEVTVYLQPLWLVGGVVARLATGIRIAGVTVEEVQSESDCPGPHPNAHSREP
jgi:phosphopantetheinyl transferase